MERPASTGAERALFVFPPAQHSTTSEEFVNSSGLQSAATSAPAGSLEALEGRRLLSSATLYSGTLMLVGNKSSNNTLGVWKSGSNLVAVHNGAQRWFSESAVRKIVVHGGNKNDNIWIADRVSKPTTLNGWAGNDTIAGGAGRDSMFGGWGNDLAFGNSGDDYGYGGEGNDTLWGGSGTDKVDGGPGEDVTNGSSPSSNSGSGGSNSSAKSPRASISAQRTQVMAGQAIHVHATNSSLGTGSPQNALYEWDFGDDDSAYNKLQGFNAAHLYDRSGTYTIKLKVTNQAGKSHTTSITVKVTANTRQRIYVSESGSDSNPGTQAKPLRSWGKVASMISRSSNVEVLFRRGDTFNAAAVMDLRGDNIVFNAYGSGSSPVIRWTDDRGGYPTMISPKGDNVTIQFLTFTSSTSNPPQAIRTSANNVTIRGNVFRTLGYAINANMKPNGLLVQGNVAPDEGGIESYFVWGEGSDHVYLGNTVANSREEHVIRVVGADRVLVWQNNLTNTVGEVSGDNTPKGALTLHKGSYFWVGRNELNDGPVAIGPLGDDDGMNDKGARFRYGVFDGNTFDTKVAIDHGAERIMFRNNIIKSAETAILVEGYDDDYDRSTSDVTIVNNTVINNQKTGRFVCVESGANGVTLANNLYVAPNMTTGSGASASVYVADDNLASFKYIGNNVWAKADASLWAQGGQNYVWPTWSSQSGYRTAGEWNGMGVVGTDHFSDTKISGYKPSSSSLAANAARWREGVFQDRYGKWRSGSSWTAGAIEL